MIDFVKYTYRRSGLPASSFSIINAASFDLENVFKFLKLSTISFPRSSLPNKSTTVDS